MKLKNVILLFIAGLVCISGWASITWLLVDGAVKFGYDKGYKKGKKQGIEIANTAMRLQVDLDSLNAIHSRIDSLK